MNLERTKEIKKVAKGIFNGEVTTSRMVHPNDMLKVFQPMRDVTLGELEEWEAEDFDCIYEWHDNAVDEDDEGNPVFDSLQFLTSEEQEFVDEEIARLENNRRKRNARKRKKKS